MSEQVEIVIIMLLFASFVYAAYLNFWVIRRLRKKLDRLVDATLSAAPPRSVLPAQPDGAEMRRLQDRLQVLERIAVEKENSLSREIDGLRASNG